jgi:Holliday junction resolvase
MRARLKFEHSLGKDLVREGWHCVRSAGSHGPFDLCAFSSTEVRLIQVKTTSAARLLAPDNISTLVTAVQGLLAVPTAGGTVTLWLYVKVMRGPWLRICVNGFPSERRACRQAVRDAIGATY